MQVKHLTLRKCIYQKHLKRSSNLSLFITQFSPVVWVLVNTFPGLCYYWQVVETLDVAWWQILTCCWKVIQRGFFFHIHKKIYLFEMQNFRETEAESGLPFARSLHKWPQFLELGGSEASSLFWVFQASKGPQGLATFPGHNRVLNQSGAVGTRTADGGFTN